MSGLDLHDYFAHCCDKMPNPGKRRKEKLVLVYSPAGSFQNPGDDRTSVKDSVVESWEAGSHVASALKKQSVVREWVCSISPPRDSLPPMSLHLLTTLWPTSSNELLPPDSFSTPPNSIIR